MLAMRDTSPRAERIPARSAKDGHRQIGMSEAGRRGADSDWNGESTAEATIRFFAGNIGGRAERIAADRRFAQASRNE